MDAKTLQELISYFEAGDTPTETNFSNFLNSIPKYINGEFTETDVDGDGYVTIDYPSSTVNGSEVTTSIARPLTVQFWKEGDATPSDVIPAEKVDTASCRFPVGGELPSGTYYCVITYQS